MTNADGMTAAQLEAMADAYERMAAGCYSGRPDRGYCEDRAEQARTEAALLAVIVPSPTGPTP